MKTRDSSPLVFILTDVSSGGIVSRIRKWTTTLANKNIPIELHTVHDRSGVYTPKITAHTFPGIPVYQHDFDSLDKSSCIINELLINDTFTKSRAIISSTFTRTGLLVEEIRLRGWKGVYVEVVPAETESTIYPIRKNLSLSNIIGAVSTKIADKFSQEYPNKPVVVLPGGVIILPLETRRKSPAHNLPFNICYAGRLDPIQKRIFDLPLVAKQLNDRGINCQWTIAGSGKQDGLIAAFNEVDLKYKPLFTGNIPYEELREILTDTHVFILPSAFEGLSNALCEAAEAGAVPIATDISGTRDVIKHGTSGFIVPVGDVTGIASYIAHLMQHPEDWEKLSIKIREHAIHNLSTTSSIDRLMDAIVSCETSGALELVNTKHDNINCSILDSYWIPNSLTRLIRRTWRDFKGAPPDVVKKNAKKKPQ